MDVVTIAIFVFSTMVGFAVGRVVGRQSALRREDKPMFIKPPRRFVDPDGRSDFRPELRVAADTARAAALQELRRRGEE